MLNVTSMEMNTSLSTWQKSARSVAFKSLQYLDVGSLSIVESFSQDSVEQNQFGKKSDDEPHAVIWVKHPDFY